MQRRLMLLCGMLGVLTGACAPKGPVGLTEADRAAIAAAGESMAVAANAGDFAKWADVQAEDVQMFPPNSDAVIGRDAIAAAMKAYPPVSNVKFVQNEVVGAGDLAYVRGSYSMTISPPGIPPIEDKGAYIEIWRKQPDGRWLISRDIYNSSVPLPAPAAP